MTEADWVRRLPESQRRPMVAGVHPLDPRRVGSSIAVVGGVVFVVANARDLGEAPDVVLATAGVLVALWAAWRLFVRPASLGRPRAPHRFAWGIYLASVAAMLALIALGRAWAEDAGHAAAAPSIVALVVGLHFVPFALAFREPMLVRLGVAVALTGAAGVGLAVLVGAPWGAAGAVVAGFVQLGVVAAWAHGLMAPRRPR